jgi:hypothetical protein
MDSGNFPTRVMQEQENACDNSHVAACRSQCANSMLYDARMEDKICAVSASPGRDFAVNPSFTCVIRAWRAHESELQNYLHHRMGDSQLAVDLLQDVFVKAMQQGNGFCNLDNPRAWLFQVARNAHAGLRLIWACLAVREALNKSQLWFDTFSVRPECRE